MEKILIAGGTGFVGNDLCQHLVNSGYQLSVLTRREMPKSEGITYYNWDTEKGFIDIKAFDGVSTIINLTGANIGEKRWTTKRKRELMTSRIQPLQLLYNYVSENSFPIKTLISSSAVGYYGAVTTEDIFDESSPAGNDFLSSVCVQWEQEAQKFEAVGSRVVILRKGLVVAPDGGAFAKLAPLATLGINPAVGSGKQYVPWIDRRNLACMYSFVHENDQTHGIFNAVAGQHLTMNAFAEGILKFYNRKSLLPNVPGVLVKLMLGEMACMVLEGSRVSNRKIQASGFNFLYDTLPQALSLT